MSAEYDDISTRRSQLQGDNEIIGRIPVIPLYTKLSCKHFGTFSKNCIRRSLYHSRCGLTILSFLLLLRNPYNKRKPTQPKMILLQYYPRIKTPIATVSVAIWSVENFNVTGTIRKAPVNKSWYLRTSRNALSLLVDKALRLSMFEKQQDWTAVWEF